MSKLVEKILSQPVLDPALSFFESLPVAVLLLDANGGIVGANAAAHELLGAARGTLSGQLAARFIAGSIDLEVSRRVTARRADSTKVPVRARYAKAPAGNASLLVTLEDASEFERELAERATEVVAANREFEKFIDVAAHDLRAPLRILRDFADALDDECAASLSEDGATFLKEIHTAGARMEGILDGMLTLARSARAEMACESLDLTTLIELVCYELRHSGVERDVDWRIEQELNGWGDVRLMMTVLRSLLGNAYKFTSRAEKATIRVYADRRGGETWYCVEDDGAGFDMAHVDRLFKPFARLHRQDEFPGHGMGLATAQVIVRRHGGRIEAKSVPGSGTTVRFTLAPRPD